MIIVYRISFKINKCPYTILNNAPCKHERLTCLGMSLAAERKEKKLDGIVREPETFYYFYSPPTSEPLNACTANINTTHKGIQIDPSKI